METHNFPTPHASSLSGQHSKMTLSRTIFRPWDASEKPATCGVPEKCEKSVDGDRKNGKSSPTPPNPRESSVTKRELKLRKSSACSSSDSDSKPPVFPLCTVSDSPSFPCPPRRLEVPSEAEKSPCSVRVSEQASPAQSLYAESPTDHHSNMFLYPMAINELANLSRNELTAIGLLPPELPSSHKTKRQRPKRFHCPHCQVAFSNNGQLRGHIRIHTGERPFVCEEESCGKSFTRNEELTRHRRIHSGLRPYPCSMCGKKFGRKDHLKKHTRTHQRVMYAPPAMIGYGHPFQSFHSPLLSTAVSNNDFSLPPFANVPAYSFPVFPSSNHPMFSTYPPL